MSTPTVRQHCPTCGAKTVEYRHALRQHLVVGLSRLHRAGGLANLKDLGLTHSERDNFQKLRYFDLAYRFYDETGKRVGGVWQITELGRRFLRSETRVWSHVWTYRGDRVRFDGHLLTVHEVLPGYQHREAWAAGAVSHGARP